MKTNLILKKAAKMLLENGYRVIAWENDVWVQEWRKGDFVSIHFGKNGERRIGNIKCGFDNIIRFGLEYVPSRENHSGCCIFEGDKITMDKIERLMDSAYPSFVKKVEEYRNFESYAEKNLRFYDFLHEVTKEELEGI